MGRKPRFDGRRLTSSHPDYDAEAQEELDARVSSAAEHAKESGLAMLLEGRDWCYIRDKMLFRQDGFDGMEPWVKRKLRLSYSKVRRRMRLADSFNDVQLEKHGATKLLDTVRYATRTLGKDRGWSASTLVFSVPQDDGHVAEVPFARATEADVQAALRHQAELAKRRAREGFSAALAGVADALKLPGTDRALAEVTRRPAPSGLEDDALVTLRLRHGDLHAVVERLAKALLASRRRERG